MLIETKEELIKENYWPLIAELADDCGMDANSYFSLTSKRWELYYDLKTDRMFGGFQGSGIYVSNGEEMFLQKTLSAMSYDYDSRYYSID